MREPGRNCLWQRRYIETINCGDPTDNCKLEFDYTSRNNKKFKNGCSYHGNMYVWHSWTDVISWHALRLKNKYVDISGDLAKKFWTNRSFTKRTLTHKNSTIAWYLLFSIQFLMLCRKQMHSSILLNTLSWIWCHKRCSQVTIFLTGIFFILLFLQNFSTERPLWLFLLRKWIKFRGKKLKCYWKL